MLAVRHGSCTDPGKQKKRNEDRAYVHPERGFYMVIDGMANDVTPHFIMETLPFQLRDAFAKVTDLSGTAPLVTLQTLLRELNDQVRNQRLDLWGNGMVGATIVVVVVRPGQALVAHLGDSRVYLRRDGQLQPITRDHSQVQQMLDAGQISPAEALMARRSSGPTRFIGMPGRAVADVQRLDLQAGDRLLLCTDGLTELLLDDDLANILAKHPDPEPAAQALVAAANAAGGHDNITAVVLAFD